jgi:VacB/RNase II family 3'-5' exoribonuclease
MNIQDQQHRAILKAIAHRVMRERGLQPDFSPQVLAEVERLAPAVNTEDHLTRDLTGLLWASIDNDDSLDLDQLSVAEAISGGQTRIRVAIADVDALVKYGSAIDQHAGYNTTSVYTAAEIFPMLPEKLSTDLTSLNFGEARQSIVVDMVIGAEGAVQAADLYPARVINKAKLAYNSVAAWLDGKAGMPPGVAAVAGLEENLRLQDKTAQKMKDFRHAHGALSLETIEARPVFKGDELYDIQAEEKNRAKDIIEDFMIAANGVTARYLASKNLPSIRRVVRVPKRWERIVEIAREHGDRLPADPDSIALEEFLTRQKAADAIHFPDLSLAVIKLLGAGEYVAEPPGKTAPGHFGLAVKDYSHSTAPNRRYTDLITQRLLKAAMHGTAPVYKIDELELLAQHCTKEEDAANKVERQVAKSAAALLLESRIGEQFDALVTGAADKGTWVRLANLPVEGKLVQGFENVDVGDRLHVQLVSVDVERGFIDFKKSGPAQNKRRL